MKSDAASVVSLALVLTSVSSLVSMISVLKIDGIIHGDLYRYGLQFSYQWAIPYWTMTSIVFAMGWFNIIASVAFQFYVLIYGRKEIPKLEISREPELQPTKEEIVGMIEIKSTEKVEESKEQATEPAEKVDTKLEEPQTVVEDTSQREQSETTQTVEVEGQKEQESKPTEESEVVETQETPTETPPTAAETETGQETPEKSEEEPILVGVPEDEPQTATEETPQEVGSFV